MKQRVALLFSASASCTAALDAQTLQLSHTAVALRRAQDTVSHAEREVNALPCSTLPDCYPMLSISNMQQFLQSWSCFACFARSRYQQVRRCTAELHHAAILCLTGEQAQADERAAADAVVVCSPFLKAVFLS